MATRSFEELAESAVANRAKKRLKTLKGEVDFVITLTPLESFARLVYTCEELLQDITFEVVKTDSFCGIRCDMTNASLVCMIKAKFSALVTMPDGVERAKFTVSTTDLKNMFKAANGQTMEILRMKGDDTLTLSCFGTPHQEFKLRTLSQDNESDRLNNIDTDYSLMLTTEEFKSFCRSVSNLGSDVLTIEIRSDGTPTTDKVVTTYTSLKSQTDSNEYSSTYKQRTKMNEDGEIRFVCDPLEESEVSPEEIRKCKILYSGDFRVDFILGFLKNSDKGKVDCCLATMEDGSPGPMIIHAGLGGEARHMRLILAPRQIDDEE
jgi:hypothetical protein